MEQIMILRQDIAKAHTDAIVNAANEGLAQGGGVCGAVFHAAGSAELNAACKKIGHCDTGEAVITPGFDLFAKWIIHTVGPIWKDGSHHEKEQLYSCYEKSLKLADAYQCRTIAFPLISSGIFGYPVKEAWKTAMEACHDYLARTCSRMQIYFCVIDDRMAALGEQAVSSMRHEMDHKTPILFHDPDQEYGCFSSWYGCSFQVEGITYSSSEQYMMARKALLFQDADHYALIMSTNSPEACQDYGRQVKNYRQDVWDQAKTEIVYHAVREKFRQNEDLLKVLLLTGSLEIGEAARHDEVWGIGLHDTDEAAEDPASWPGQNLLGKILMKVRAELFSQLCRQKKIRPLDLKCLFLPVIRKQEIPARTGGGAFSPPAYPEEVTCLSKAMYDLDLIDRNYLWNYAKLKEKCMDDLSQDDILTIYTYLIRGERFCDGLIAEKIRNGCMEQLGNQLRKQSEHPAL